MRGISPTIQHIVHRMIFFYILQSWDEYYKYVNSINIQSAKLNEYKNFLEEFKKAGFKNSVYFDFKEMHFDS
jgi:hypothetical protein